MKTSNIVILGSGITGLCAGAILSKLKHNVTVLEAHPSLIGGHARTYNINGLKFCAGPQYLWNFSSNNNAIGDRVLKFLELDQKIQFEQLDQNSFETLHIGSDDVFNVPMGLDRFLKKMISRFPESKKNLKNFFKYVEAAYNISVVLTDNGLLIKKFKWTIFYLLFSTKISLKDRFNCLSVFSASLQDVYSKLNIPPLAQQILFGHAGLFAENTTDLAFIVYAAATGAYHHKAVFPKTGMDSIVNGLATSIENNGGKVLTNKKIVALTHKENKITSIKCEDESIYPCDIAISTIATRLLFPLIEGLSGKMVYYKPSNSTTMFFLSLENYPHINKLKKRNLWYQDLMDYTNTDIFQSDMTNSPIGFLISSSTANGVINNNGNSTYQAITIFSPGNFKQAKANKNKGEIAYQKFKKDVTDKVLEKVEEKLLPDIRKYIKHIKILTPNEIQQETLSEKGNIYGRRLTFSTILNTTADPHNMKNMFIACATEGLPGVAIAFQAAVTFVKQITGIKI